MGEQTPSSKERKVDRHVSGWARLAGSSTSGILEIIFFHPFDTAGKRLMSNQSPVFASGRTFKESLTIANEVTHAAHRARFRVAGD